MDRIARFRDAIKLQKTQGALITKESNIFYLSGYTGEGALLVTPERRIIITDFRYTEQAEIQAPGFEVLMTEKNRTLHTIIKEALASETIGELYYEDDHLTVRQDIRLKEALPGIRFLSTNGSVEALRKYKDEKEIALIKEACEVSCKAFEQILQYIRPGMTEKQIQLKLDYTMLELGADGLAFQTISAAGERGSLPHAIPSDRKVLRGDMLTLDFGARKSGYDADMTRTVAIGTPSSEMRRIYETVLHAQTECEEMLAPGRICSDIDAHARKIIDGNGYEGRFGHGLGHSVGIDIHEEPRLSGSCSETLAPGVVITVEPGIYIPGLGGVRIEDTCVITEDSYRSLVCAPKELIVL